MDLHRNDVGPFFFLIFVLLFSHFLFCDIIYCLSNCSKKHVCVDTLSSDAVYGRMSNTFFNKSINAL